MRRAKFSRYEAARTNATHKTNRSSSVIARPSSAEAIQRTGTNERASKLDRFVARAPRDDASAMTEAIKSVVLGHPPRIHS
jgi:hypothetical protein